MTAHGYRLLEKFPRAHRSLSTGRRCAWRNEGIKGVACSRQTANSGIMSVATAGIGYYLRRLAAAGS